MLQRYKVFYKHILSLLEKSFFVHNQNSLSLIKNQYICSYSVFTNQSNANPQDFENLYQAVSKFKELSCFFYFSCFYSNVFLLFAVSYER